MSEVQYMIGDCLASLKTLPSESVTGEPSRAARAFDALCDGKADTGFGGCPADARRPVSTEPRDAPLRAGRFRRVHTGSRPAPKPRGGRDPTPDRSWTARRRRSAASRFANRRSTHSNRRGLWCLTTRPCTPCARRAVCIGGRQGLRALCDSCPGRPASNTSAGSVGYAPGLPCFGIARRTTGIESVVARQEGPAAERGPRADQRSAGSRTGIFPGDPSVQTRRGILRRFSSWAVRLSTASIRHPMQKARLCAIIPVRLPSLGDHADVTARTLDAGPLWKEKA